MHAAIHQNHPFINLIYYGCVGTLIMLYAHPLFLISAIIILILTNVIHGNKENISKLLPYYLIMSLIIIVANPLFVDRGSIILFYIRHNPVTLESIIYGVVMALMLMAILILFSSFNHVISGRKFLFLCRKVWPQLGLLLMLTIRFVPLFVQRWRDIYEVQKNGSYSITHGSLKQRAKFRMYYLQKLLTWSLEEALQSAESMKARGYGVSKRSIYQIFKMSSRDWLVVACFILFTFLSIDGARQSYGVLTIYPELGTITFTALDWGYYFLFLVIISFPLILEGGEFIKWRLWK